MLSATKKSPRGDPRGAPPGPSGVRGVACWPEVSRWWRSRSVGTPVVETGVLLYLLVVPRISAPVCRSCAAPCPRDPRSGCAFREREVTARGTGGAPRGTDRDGGAGAAASRCREAVAGAGRPGCGWRARCQRQSARQRTDGVSPGPRGQRRETGVRQAAGRTARPVRRAPSSGRATSARRSRDQGGVRE